RRPRPVHSQRLRPQALGAGGPDPPPRRFAREPAAVQEEVDVSERGIIARHAGTVLAGQLATMAFGVTDTIVAGRFSQQAPGALSVGSAVFITVFVAMMGIFQALLPTWAELHGAQRHLDVGRSVRQALYLAGLASVIG